MTRLLLVFLLGTAACRAPEPDDSSRRRDRDEERSNTGGNEVVQPAPRPTPTPTPVEAPPAQANLDPRLLNPRGATEQAPARYAVELDTTKGPVIIDVTRAWSPNGADRFYNLVKIGYFSDIAFFRVIEGFMAQGGIHGNPRVNAAWRDANIQDDPAAGQSNTRGMVTYAMGGPNTRTTQFFINYGNNSRLDPMGFTPFGRVRDMRAVDAFYKGYGDGPPGGRGPQQGRIQRQGNSFLREGFPELDYIRSARILEE
ncbi:MAG: peptidylprolyl isomerase [Myxococcota bacterium]